MKVILVLSLLVASMAFADVSQKSMISAFGGESLGVQEAVTPGSNGSGEMSPPLVGTYFQFVEDLYNKATALDSARFNGSVVSGRCFYSNAPGRAKPSLFAAKVVTDNDAGPIASQVNKVTLLFMDSYASYFDIWSIVSVNDKQFDEPSYSRAENALILIRDDETQRLRADSKYIYAHITSSKTETVVNCYYFKMNN